MNAPSRLVVRFLASIGRPAEAELYLSLFRAERPESFALIAVDAEVTGVAAEALAFDLEFLAELGLSPVVALASAEQTSWLASWLADTGRAEQVSPDRAAQVAGGRRIPLVTAPPDQVAALAASLTTRKVVLLGPHGGLARAGEPVSLVDVATEYDSLAAPGALPDAQLTLLARARALIDAADHPMTVAITSPLELLRELFTVRGAGTLVRRGAPIAVHAGWDGVDRARLAALIETAFGRRLRPSFWDRLPERVLLAGDYRGAAVVELTPQGPYLSKLAVGAAARGEGIGRDLWRALAREYRTLTWRGRAGNPIAPWYQEQCDGMAKLGAWHVYWRGLSPADIPAALAAASAAPVDLDDPA
jgi:hypothetical protein